jgi:hypothetical protein
MAKRAEAASTVYKRVEVIGTSTQSWEDAAKNAPDALARVGLGFSQAPRFMRRRAIVLRGSSDVSMIVRPVQTEIQD